MERFSSSGSTMTGVRLFLGTSIPSSYADTITFTCNNSGNTANNVLCPATNAGNNVGSITITDVQQLSNDERAILNGSLNDLALNVLGVNLQGLQTARTASRAVSGLRVDRAACRGSAPVSRSGRGA